MSHITIGHLYTALHAGCASAVARVVEANGVDVAFADLSVGECDAALENGEIDLLVSVWLPRDEALLRAGRRAIGALYQPFAGFYSLTERHSAGTLPAGKFSAALVSDEAWTLFEKAASSRSFLSALPAERIEEDLLIERLETARTAGENPLIVAFQPHAVFHTGLLTPVEDSDSLLGGEMAARMILRDGAAERLDEDLLDELSGMMLGNKVMSALDHAISCEGVDPDAAAESWQRGRLLPR